MANWILPEFIADVLPFEARKIEDLRRRVLDKFRSYGYEFVIPPMMEYLDSLLRGVGQDTEIYTFKLVDQLSGRTMGVRADMTTQIARIDAHLLNRSGVTRLSYAGTVLHARPSGLQATREPLQCGAEIFGYPGIEADAEIQNLALDALRAGGIEGVCLDLSHVGILRALVKNDPQTQAFEAELFDLLETKDMPGLVALTKIFRKDTREALLELPNMYGDVRVLDEAKKVLPEIDGITKALSDLAYLVGHAGSERVTIDLADLHGYHYHSGVMFAAYVPGLPNAIARGGRYDHVAEAFGRSRPATGFSMDLRELSRVMPAQKKRSFIRAPWKEDAALFQKIAALRDAGEIVIFELPHVRSEHDEFVCDRCLVQEANSGSWILKPVSNE